MGKQRKVIWFYSVLLFSAALLLIVISALSQSRITPRDELTWQDEQQAFNQTIQKSVTELIRENERLRGELKEATEKGEKLEEEKASFEMDNKDKQLLAEAHEFLIEAEMLFNVGNYAKSRDVLQNVNAHVLTENGVQLYKWLVDKLGKKSYTLQN